MLAQSKDEHLDERAIVEPSYCTNCDEPDIFFVSCERAIFPGHSQDLERYRGLPPVSSLLRNVVYLNEDSYTVERLLEFMHSESQANIETLPILRLETLANAFKKYKMRDAMMACKLCMKTRIPKEAMYVLRYAINHKDMELADQAAACLALEHRLDQLEMFFGDTSPIFRTWVTYLDTGMRIALDRVYKSDIPFFVLHEDGRQDCELWVPFRDSVRREVDHSPTQITQFEAIVNNKIKTDFVSCYRCAERARGWVNSIKVSMELLPFSAFWRHPFYPSQYTT